MKMTDRSGLRAVWGMKMTGRNQDEGEQAVTRGGRVEIVQRERCPDILMVL